MLSDSGWDQRARNEWRKPTYAETPISYHPPALRPLLHTCRYADTLMRRCPPPAPTSPSLPPSPLCLLSPNRATTYAESKRGLALSGAALGSMTCRNLCSIAERTKSNEAYWALIAAAPPGIHLSPCIGALLSPFGLFYRCIGLSVCRCIGALHLRRCIGTPISPPTPLFSSMHRCIGVLPHLSPPPPPPDTSIQKNTPIRRHVGEGREGGGVGTSVYVGACSLSLPPPRGRWDMFIRTAAILSSSSDVNNIRKRISDVHRLYVISVDAVGAVDSVNSGDADGAAAKKKLKSPFIVAKTIN